MNVMMMLERGRDDRGVKSEATERKDRQTTKIIGERAPWSGTAKARPVKSHYKYNVLQIDDDSRDEDADTDNDSTRECGNESVQSVGE